MKVKLLLVIIAYPLLQPPTPTPKLLAGPVGKERVMAEGKVGDMQDKRVKYEFKQC